MGTIAGTGLATVQVLACMVILQGVMATGSFVRVDQSGCHSDSVILNCPSYNQSKKGNSLRWRFKNNSSGNWQNLATIRRGKIRVTSSGAQFDQRLTLHTNGSLEIKLLQARDETHYLCLVRGYGTRDIHMIELSVTCDGKTTVTKRQVCTQDEVTLDCEAKHRTNPRHLDKITWKKRDSDVSWSVVAASDRRQDGHLKLHQNGSLVLKAERKEGVEEFRCVASKTNTRRDERHIIKLMSENCRREKRQIGNIKTTEGRGNMTSVPTTGTTVTMETPTTQATKVCGGNLTAVTGGFQSPNFPSAYPANAHCKWTISVPQNYAAIDIKFEQMDLEDDDNCEHDYIAIYDNLGNQVDCRRCGVYNKPRKLQVGGRVAVIVFRTDGNAQKTGFKLTYKAAMLIGNATQMMPKARV